MMEHEFENERKWNLVSYAMWNVERILRVKVEHGTAKYIVKPQSLPIKV